MKNFIKQLIKVIMGVYDAAVRILIASSIISGMLTAVGKILNISYLFTNGWIFLKWSLALLIIIVLIAMLVVVVLAKIYEAL